MMSIRGLWLGMKQVLRLARRVINDGLRPLGLSGAEGDILFILLTGSDGLSQEELAEQLDIGKAAVSRVVGSLEAKGYVRRERRRGDRRAFCVLLTDRAHSAGGSIKGVYEGLYARVRKDISDTALSRIGSLLGGIAANLESGGTDNDN